jgi:hypothetical protein
MHRDETFRVTKRNSQETIFSAAVLPVPREASMLKTVDCPADTQADRAGGGASPTIIAPACSPAISPDLESTALGFFFHHYSRAGAGPDRDIEATCSFFEYLPAMYAGASVSSPLRRATAAFAVSVADLYSPRRRTGSGDDDSACRRYVDAVAETKTALADPTRSRSDELLMTTLVLEAYDGIASSFRRQRQTHAHALGSIALLEHRGAFLNGRSELSRRMAIAAGARFVRDAVGGMASLAAVRRLWEDAGVTSLQSPAIAADMLALELARLECLRPSPGILSQASELASRCVRWRTTLPREWKAAPVPVDALVPSIRAAGAYSSPTAPVPHCDVYRNLSVANTRNRHRITELRILALMQTSIAAIWSNRSRHYEPLPLDLRERAQALLDEICASVPFFAGDAKGGFLLHDLHHARRAIQLPHMSRPRSARGSPDDGATGFPEDEAGYAKQVATSGMWMIRGTLAAALELLAESQALGTVPREGQVWWIRSQLSRLQAVLFEPTLVAT